MTANRKTAARSDFACTEAFRTWANYVQLTTNGRPATTIVDGAYKQVLDQITAPPPGRRSIERGDLAFVFDGRRHWFAHKNGRPYPLMWAAFVEGADAYDLIECPAAGRAALASNANVTTQENLNRLLELAA